MLPLATSRAQRNTIPATTSTSAKRAEEHTHAKDDAICEVTGSSPLSRSRRRAATVYFLFPKQSRDSGLPSDVLVGKLDMDPSFELPPFLSL